MGKGIDPRVQNYVLIAHSGATLQIASQAAMTSLEQAVETHRGKLISFTTGVMQNLAGDYIVTISYILEPYT